MKGIFNLFELPGVLEYQFRENHIAFNITCLLNCIGICNVLTELRLWSISLKCNTIQQYIISELILKDVSVGRVVCRAIKPGLYAREKTHLTLMLVLILAIILLKMNVMK
jgi:hypothetical protein